ncbi:MAG: Gfo/Idh/MocA family oxidoreductase [Holosporaceae bacterium]|jgi:predicted dehydrogenase|nr:Gfo/Idh/MocA family oxidoreductase [Holosporaceae bacterium]
MYDSLIIGAGKIAAGFDSPDDCNVLTQAHAYKKHPEFNLLGFYDVDMEKARLAAGKWGCRCFENLQDVANVDVVSICTPDDCHLESVQQAVKLQPKLIFLEKPVAGCGADAVKLMDMVQNLPVAVNYSRRYVKEFQNLRERIAAGEFGNFSGGSGYYGKGFIHNGSHMIDLLRFLIGEIVSIHSIDSMADFYDHDPSLSTDVFFQNNVRFKMGAVDCNCYTIFELDLFFPKARVRIVDSGFRIEIYKVVADEMFVGHRRLQKAENFSTELASAMGNALENISNFLNGKEKLLCNLEDGYEAMRHG